MKLFAMVKKYAVNLLALLTVFFFSAISTGAQGSVPDSLSVEYMLPGDKGYTIEAFVKNHRYEDEVITDETVEYVLVLPAGAKNTLLKVNIADDSAFVSEDLQLYDGEKTVLPEGRFYDTEKGYAVSVMYSSDIPDIFIDTHQSFEYLTSDKNNRASGHIAISDTVKMHYNGPLEYIKGRGNATWENSKKPFNIKLQTKAGLFGMEPSKKYVLMANSLDETNLRNALAMEQANRAGIDFCLQYQYVNLYINHSYQGLYMLTEKVEVDDGRVDILDLDYINEQANPKTNLSLCEVHSNVAIDDYASKNAYKWCDIPRDMTAGLGGGYLLEIEMAGRYFESPSGFVSSNGEAIVIKSPEYATKGQVEYIREYYQQFEDALFSADGYNSDGKHYSEYIDMESMAKMYVLQEYTQNLDAALTSFYLCKDAGGKLKACAPWDFDYSLGNRYRSNGTDLSKADNIWVATGGMLSNSRKKTILSTLFSHGDFRREAVRQWQNCFLPDVENILAQKAFTEEKIHRSSLADTCKWNRQAHTMQEAEKRYTDAVASLEEYISARAEFMTEFLCSDAYYVIYDVNGKRFSVTDTNSYAENDTATIKTAQSGKAYETDLVHFLGWNTQPDGSGTAYQPGETVQIKDSDVVLYAQWDNPPQVEAAADAPQNKAGFFASVIIWLKNLFN